MIDLKMLLVTNGRLILAERCIINLVVCFLRRILEEIFNAHRVRLQPEWLFRLFDKPSLNHSCINGVI